MGKGEWEMGNSKKSCHTESVKNSILIKPTMGLSPLPKTINK